jgi:hypothetical protein
MQDTNYFVRENKTLFGEKNEYRNRPRTLGSIIHALDPTDYIRSDKGEKLVSTSFTELYHTVNGPIYAALGVDGTINAIDAITDLDALHILAVDAKVGPRGAASRIARYARDKEFDFFIIGGYDPKDSNCPRIGEKYFDVVIPSRYDSLMIEWLYFSSLGLEPEPAPHPDTGNNWGC